MFWHFIKITFRNYRKNLLFTSIIVLGLAISIATILVITRYVIQEYRTDKFHKEFKNIYLALNVNPESNTSTVKQDWAEKFMSGYPEVKQTCRIDRIELTVNNQSGPIQLNNVLSTDPSFLKIFSFPVIKGDSANPLQDVQSIVLTESMATKLFGKEDALGKVVKTQIGHDENLLTVTAITKDPPADSRIQFEALVSFENHSFHFRSMGFSKPGVPNSFTQIFMCDIYLLLHEKADIPLLNNRLKKDSYWEVKENNYFYFLRLQPYSELYFDKNQSDGFKHGDKTMLFVFLSLAVLLILLACINFINLTTIKAFSRTKEVAFKKVAGASRGLLSGQFLFESVGMSVLAFILALFLSKYMAHLFSKMINASVDITYYYQMPQLVYVLLFSILLGIVSGYYPSMILSRVKTSELFKGKNMAGGFKFLLPKNLFIFQFTIAIALIISSVIIQKQLNYINTKDLGFDKKQLLHIAVPADLKPYALREELLKNPGIQDVALSYGIPGNLAATDGEKWFIMTDTSFLGTFGMKLVEGSNFQSHDKDVCLINETLMKQKGWSNCKGKQLEGKKVIGVVKDFHTSSLYEKIAPLEIDYIVSYLSDMTVRLDGANDANTLDFIKKTWKTVAPYSPMEYYFYDEWFDRKYKKEEAFGSLISIFTFIAIFIACLGLFGLLSYLVERRAKEIGIRKINGAENTEIMVLLNRDFIKWVAVAFVLATPIAWFVLHTWLKNFAYKTELRWWFFALAGLVSLIIALVTVSWKSWFAAKRNPVEILKYE